jgi:hypothetical protein
MAIAIGTATDNGAYTSDSNQVSWSFDAGGYPLLVVVRAGYTGGTGDDVTGVSYNTIPLTQLGKVGLSNSRWTYLYGLLTPASGVNTILVTATNDHYLYGCAVSYSGVTAFGQVVTASEGTTATDDFSLGLTTQYTDSWVVAGIGSEDANFQGGTGTTLRCRMEPFKEPGFIDNNQAVAADTAVTLHATTTPLGFWCGVAVELRSTGTIPAAFTSDVNVIATASGALSIESLFASSVSVTLAATGSMATSVVKTVGVGGDYTTLQAAVNAAQPGWILELTSGVTYSESVVLPATVMAPPVTIRSSTAAPDRRVTVNDANNMATISAAAYPDAAVTGGGVNGWTFSFVRFYRDSSQYNYVYLYNENLGGGSFRNTQNVVFDRCLASGGQTESCRNALYLNGAYITVDRCCIENIRKQGNETKAIVLQEGPGPFTITDNYLEAASINILFGGGDTSSAEHIANNILIADNHLFKRPEWEGGVYGTKNLLELKTATNVTIEDNIIENNWSGGQDGYGILFQPVNDTANSPWNCVQDVLFQRNRITSERGINILGYEWQTAYTSSQTTRVTFRNNLFVLSGAFLKAGGEVGTLTIEHNTVINGGNLGALYFGGVHPAGQAQRDATAAIQTLTFRNNLCYANGGLSGDGTAAGMDTLNMYVDTLTWTHNVLANKVGSESYPNTNWHPTGAEYLANFAADYTLTAGSTYHDAGSDGLDLGWLMDATVVVILLTSRLRFGV